ncbi:MAG: PLP-dependent aminotransferase family protein [Saprospiraceae bacterium]|nr:PLP-dependent aminotransferase family protein [Saprospiraceae bacterium]
MIHLDRKAPRPLYLQLCNQLIVLISQGTLPRGTRLPGSRNLATQLGLNRRTIMSALEELEAQGWVEIREHRGCYVSSELPLRNPQALGPSLDPKQDGPTSFSWQSQFDFLEYYTPPPRSHRRIVIDAGYPDVRLAPHKELMRHLSSIARSRQQVHLLSYADQFTGDIKLRQELCRHLQQSRGLQIKEDQIMITRGSLMAFYLIFRCILQSGDYVAVGDVSFKVANNIIRLAGGQLMEIPIDEDGLDIDVLERQCQTKAPKAVFIMPHHHNPTTVSLSAERRMRLLMLARQYHFAIVEDDYDYDFHYTNSPILPMASADKTKSVIYVGSLSKTVAPGLRTGYIVAHPKLIDDLSRISRFIDCHGNHAQERAISMLYADGTIRRHLKKSLQAYRERCHHFYGHLMDLMGDMVSCRKPDGGLAAWVQFEDGIDIHSLRKLALSKGLQITKPVFSDRNGQCINAIRMGFASLTKAEMRRALIVLRDCALDIRPAVAKR